MDELGVWQRAAYEALEAPCLLRVCTANDALWICDLPRRVPSACAAGERLRALGAVIAEENGLWKLDWAPERYAALASALPTVPPPFPRAEALHQRYGLCRLLLAHPAPLPRQPLPLLRLALKLPGMSEPAGRKAIDTLWQESAALLRKREPLPSMAGGLLARELLILNERGDDA